MTLAFRNLAIHIEQISADYLIYKKVANNEREAQTYTIHLFSYPYIPR